MDELSLEESQELIFSNVGLEVSNRLPKNITLSAIPSERTLLDLQRLQDYGLITWDFNMKSSSWGTPVSNPEHMIKCVAYYGDGVDGYYCVGYAIGCINVENTTIEINFIEKRRNASEELKEKFLPIISDAFIAYRNFLNEFDVESHITKIALVGPIPGVQKYYAEQGFDYVNDYLWGSDAMVKDI